MKTLFRVAAVVIVVLAVSVPLLVPGDGAERLPARENDERDGNQWIPPRRVVEHD